MVEPPPRDRCFPWVFATLILAMLIPFLRCRFLPLVDLPGHLAVARMISEAPDASSVLSRFFVVRTRFTPYLGFYGFVVALHELWIPWETAARLFVLLLVAGIPVGTAFLARALGRSPWLAILALPLTYSHPFFLGLLNYMLGVALLLFAIAAFATRMRGDGLRGPRGGLVLVLLPLALLFAHAQTYAFFLPSILALAFALRGDWKRTLAFALPSLVIFLVWFVPVSTGVAPPGTAPGPRFEFVPVLEKIEVLPAFLTNQFQDAWDTRLLAGFGILLGAAWIAGLRRPRRPDRASIAAWLLAAGGVTAYLVAPETMRLGSLLHLVVFERFAILAALLLVVAVPIPPGAFPKALAAGTIALVVATALHLGVEFSRFDDEARGFEELATHVEPGTCVGSLAGLVPTKVFVQPLMFTHFSGWLTVWRGTLPGDTFATGNESMPIAPRRADGAAAGDVREAMFPVTEAMFMDRLRRGGGDASALLPFYRYLLSPTALGDPSAFLHVPPGTVRRIADGGPFTLYFNPYGTCRAQR